MSKEDLLKQARQAVMEGDEEAAEAVANKVIAEGINPAEIINEGLSPAMTEEWADKIGCDCYAEDANDTVLKAKELIK
jgi:dimethylamine corrinoid protein